MSIPPSDIATSSGALRPRVVLLTSPGLFGAEIINRLAAEPGINLVGVGLTARLYKNKGTLATALTFGKRTGWRYLVYQALIADVSWTVLRTSGRPSGLKQSGADVRSLLDVNDDSTLEWLRGLSPDIIASFYFNQWIGPAVRTIPVRGCINLHPSLLPALRGPDPVFRTLERGLATTGFTIHDVHDDFDAGRILHQETFPIPPGATAFGLFHLLIRGGADLLARWLAGTVTPSVPETSEPTATNDYRTFPTPAEVAAFHKQGQRLIRLREWREALAAVS